MSKVIKHMLSIYHHYHEYNTGHYVIVINIKFSISLMGLKIVPPKSKLKYWSITLVLAKVASMFTDFCFIALLFFIHPQSYA